MEHWTRGLNRNNDSNHSGSNHHTCSSKITQTRIKHGAQPRTNNGPLPTFTGSRQVSYDWTNER